METAKKKDYEDGRSQTEMDPTLIEIVSHLERQANAINDMSKNINMSLYYAEDDLQNDGSLVLETAMPIMERLSRVIKLNYETANNMERLINKIK